MPANSALQYDVKVSGLLPAAAEPPPNGERPHRSPLSHTLIHGPTEAVLVDPPITVAQTAALADWIAASGKRLACVYITHWHTDHWLGTGELVARFSAMLTMYPERVNPYTVWLSASRLLGD
jgi:glyoxylase-like metal-dependent hydrolase (beta-lactamase superfamily II)